MLRHSQDRSFGNAGKNEPDYQHQLRCARGEQNSASHSRRHETYEFADHTCPNPIGSSRSSNGDLRVGTNGHC